MISIFDSIIIDENERLLSINNIIIYLKALKYDAVICMTIVYVIFWDTRQSENTLNRNGVSSFCIGFHVVLEMRSIEIPIHSSMGPTTTVIDDIRWVFFLQIVGSDDKTKLIFCIEPHRNQRKAYNKHIWYVTRIKIQVI
jgi:hypothetical protein